MRTFEFIYGCVLGELILRHTDNLSSTLQHKSMSAAEGQEIARMTVDTLICLSALNDLSDVKLVAGITESAAKVISFVIKVISVQSNFLHQIC